jgi:hypothetical protein
VNPFALATHLIDDHHQHDTFVDGLDSDALRSYHADCHRSGQPDHTHEDRP